MRILNLAETIEDKAQRLREISGRPVYITHDSHPTSLQSILRPKEDSTTLHIAMVYAPEWEPRPYHENRRLSLIEEREAPAGDPKEITARRDAESRAESKRVSEMYRAVGLAVGHGFLSAEIGKCKVPAVLVPYIRDLRRTYGHQKGMYKGIRFWISDSIAASKVVRERWEAGRESAPTTDGVVRDFRRLLPPGRYNGKDDDVSDYYNQYVITDRDPGSCICCHGASGARKHLAHGSYTPTSLICSVCAKTAFSEWMALLEQD
jgi:hypothetical protein